MPKPTTLELLKNLLRTDKPHGYPLVYMGDNGGGAMHPDRATPHPIFAAFAAEYPELFPHDENSKGAGNSNKHYASFRDDRLPRALREIRAEALGVPVNDVEETEYMYKKELLKSGERAVRRVKGWQVLTERNAHARCPQKAVDPLLALPKAYEAQQEDTDDASSTTASTVDETEMYPPYDEADAATDAPIAEAGADAAPMEVEAANEIVDAPKKRKRKSDEAYEHVLAAHERDSLTVGEHTASKTTIRAFTSDPEWKRWFTRVKTWTGADCHKSYSMWYNAQARDDGKRHKRA